MSERRPFPPSLRRVALARQAGLTASSPLIVGALACGAVVMAAVMLARTVATRLGVWIADACSQRPSTAALDHAASSAPMAPTHVGSATSNTAPLDPAHIASASSVPPFDSAHIGSAASSADHLGLALNSAAHAVFELAVPLLAAAALAAVFAHLAQTRSLWLPRRKISGAPAMPRSSGLRASFDLSSALVIGAVTFGWLWLTAPRLAAMFALDDRNGAEHPLASLLAAAGAAIASLVIALAVTWLALGVLDALLRHAQLSGALAMTPTEKREDDRLAAADPRWAQRRRELSREPAAGPAVARAAVLLLGDDVAVAIAWDPVRQPVPIQTASGRKARATQLLALARRYRVPVHRDAPLAAALGDAAAAPRRERPVPEAHWARLAEIVAALRGR